MQDINVNNNHNLAGSRYLVHESALRIYSPWPEDGTSSKENETSKKLRKRKWATRSTAYHSSEREGSGIACQIPIRKSPTARASARVAVATVFVAAALWVLKDWCSFQGYACTYLIAKRMTPGARAAPLYVRDSYHASWNESRIFPS